MQKGEDENIDVIENFCRYIMRLTKTFSLTIYHKNMWQVFSLNLRKHLYVKTQIRTVLLNTRNNTSFEKLYLNM